MFIFLYKHNAIWMIDKLLVLTSSSIQVANNEIMFLKIKYFTYVCLNLNDVMITDTLSCPATNYED
jgi:hypothetical protein